MESTEKKPTKLGGAMLTFFILQIVYVFSMMTQFPASLNQLLDNVRNSSWMHTISSCISMLTLLAYSILCLISILYVALRKHSFLRYFQLAGIIALCGNFVVYILRQILDYSYSTFVTFQVRDVTYYWTLFLLALFWTVIWSVYFARSSRVFSYMSENRQYSNEAVFFKGTKEPEPWKETTYNYPQQQYPYPVQQDYRNRQPTQQAPQPQVPYPPVQPQAAPYPPIAQSPYMPQQRQMSGQPQIQQQTPEHKK